MSNLGELWKQRLAEAETARTESNESAKKQETGAAFQKVIQRIKSDLSKAMQKGEGEIWICLEFGGYEPTNEDFACAATYPTNRSVAYDLGMAGKTVLSADQFVGRVRRIIEWCESNGLECFLRQYVHSDPNDSDTFILAARPKK